MMVAVIVSSSGGSRFRCTSAVWAFSLSLFVRIYSPIFVIQFLYTRANKRATHSVSWPRMILWFFSIDVLWLWQSSFSLLFFLFFAVIFFFVQINSTIFLAFCFSRFWVAHLWNFFVSFVLRTEHTDHEYRRSCENQFVANFTSTDDESEIWILCSCEAIKCLMQQIFSSVELFQAKSFAKTSIHWRIHSPKRPAAMSCSNAHTQKRNIFQFDFWFSFYFYCGQFVRFVRIEFSRCCFIADCRTSFSTSNLIFPSVSDFAAGSKW